MFDLSGRGALVTGSTQGIGRAIADALSASGARTVYHGLQGDAALGEGCVSLDLLRPDAPGVLLERALELAPELSILVCNAGGFFDAPFAEITPQAFDQTFDLNVRAPFFLAQAFARHLMQSGRGGSIVFVSSTNGLQSEPDSNAYDASKGALLALTRSLAISLAPHQIRVNALAPGLIRTPLTECWLDTQHEQRQHYEKNIPLGRIGAPSDCGAAAVFLCCDEARYITGQTLVVDGGLTAAQIGPV